MYTNIFSKKGSIVSTIIAIVIAGVMVGCQKETEDEIIHQISVKKIDENYNPVRLKSTDKTLVVSLRISQSNPKEYVVLDGNKTYDLYFESAEYSATSWVKMITGTQTISMSHTLTNFSVPEIYELKTEAAGGTLTLEYEKGAAGRVSIYRYN